MTPNQNSPTLALPRITATKFKELLQSKNSPAVSASQEIYDILISQGVDPSFALAQFRVESQYGTAGYAKLTGSWGNMLTDSNLTTLQVDTYAPGNGYTYAVYNNYEDAVTDYCRYLHWYKDHYAFDTIYEATARWIGKIPGSPGHLSYVSIIINDMINYETIPGQFYEVGDEMIYGGDSVDRATGKLLYRYPVASGLALYKGTSDAMYLKKYQGTAGKALFLGPTQDGWKADGTAEWGSICIGTDWADPQGTWLYIKNVSKSKRIKV